MVRVGVEAGGALADGVDQLLAEVAVALVAKLLAEEGLCDEVCNAANGDDAAFTYMVRSITRRARLPAAEGSACLLGGGG